MSSERPTDRGAVAQILYNQFCDGLTGALQTMLAEPPSVAWESGSAPEGHDFVWKQALTPFQGALWVTAPQSGYAEIGRQVMSNLGVDAPSKDECIATAQEAVGQAFGAVVRTLTSELGREVVVGPGATVPLSGGLVSWAQVYLNIGETQITLGLGSSHELADALLAAYCGDAAPPPPPKTLAASASVAGSPPIAPPSGGMPTVESPSLDRLLDVELSVSVSFGKAYVPLKEVLKLTNGSIIELNRAVVEPVDILVNNCVIARGEVVVVEGNFGVRIQRVVSRGERLETLR